jgi:hypothetical protein
MAVTQAAFVPTGSVENDPGSPPPEPLPRFAPSPKSETPEPPHASSATVTAERKRFTRAW